MSEPIISALLPGPTRVRRGAVVKAMAICTRHPFIQIFKASIAAVLPSRSLTPPPARSLARFG